MPEISMRLPVKFFSAGQFVGQSDWVHQRRKLDSSVLFLVESGGFTMCEDGARWELGEHEALILEGGRTHYGEKSMGEQCPVYYWAHFAFTENAPSEPSGGGQNILVKQHMFCRDYGRLSILFHQLISESRAANAHPLSCDYLMSLLLIALSVDDESSPSPGALPARLQEYMRLNYKRNITLEELSNTFHYNADYLSKLFRNRTGKPIKRYQHELRLTHAKELLLSTVKSIKEIAYESGYVNEKFFITTFMRYEGVSPTKYRNTFGTLHQNNDT